MRAGYWATEGRHEHLECDRPFYYVILFMCACCLFQILKDLVGKFEVATKNERSFNRIPHCVFSFLHL